MIALTTIGGEPFVERRAGKRTVTESPIVAKRALRDLIERETERLADLQRDAEAADAAVRRAVMDDMDAAQHRARATEVIGQIVAAHHAIAGAKADLAAIDERVDRLVAAAIDAEDAARIDALLSRFPIPEV